ncbi:hypothetical protein FQN57_001991 [Myotisia sp. PD_48]|nr:hypothetical protein FQN57_001991 [Myotisia sp. PD_48]
MASGDTGVVLARAVSRLLGWIYMFCWSASFYPQPIFNWRRRSTHGLAIDFPTSNVLGFVCYAIYTSAFLYSPVIRSQYAARYPTSPEPTVRGNDLAFAVHAVVLSTLVYSQFFPAIWGFKVSRSQRASQVILGIVWGSTAAILAIVGVVWYRGGMDPFDWAWIDVIYTISYVKLLVTVIKYVPQAWVNYKRKSTVGWNIWQIILDLTGGVLSLLQLVIDSMLQGGDWSGITGNPVKFGLSNVSILFDLIFIVQHYILYREKGSKHGDEDDDGARAPLLPNTRSNAI